MIDLAAAMEFVKCEGHKPSQSPLLLGNVSRILKDEGPLLVGELMKRLPSGVRVRGDNPRITLMSLMYQSGEFTHTMEGWWFRCPTV